MTQSALAWLLGGLYLQLRTITIDQDTLVSKGLFRDPIVIDRRDVSALELRFSAFQLENISSRRDEIVQPGWSTAGDNESEILLKVGCPNYLDVFRQQDRKFAWPVRSGCDF